MSYYLRDTNRSSYSQSNYMPNTQSQSTLNEDSNLMQDVPDYGSAFVCGKSRFEAEKFHVKDDPILDLACGDEHTGIVTSSGRVFMFGLNNWGQLGLGHENNVDKPSCIKSMKHERVVLIACGRNHTILATEIGNLYAFGCNSESQLGLGDKEDSFFNTPQKISSVKPQEWKAISAGSSQSCAVSESGYLYVWGNNDNGELGAGSAPELRTPKKIDLNFIIVDVSCGYYHTAILSKKGKLYTSGSNEYSQLGHHESGKTFQEVDTNYEQVKTVACGANHTIYTTFDDKVFSFGDGSFGQLGLGDEVLKSSLPKQIKSLDRYRVVKVSSGERHSAFITDKGVLFTSGDNRYGKLGLNQKAYDSIQFEPILVKKYQQLKVKNIACGGCHMILVGALSNENTTRKEYDDERRYEEPKLSSRYDKENKSLPRRFNDDDYDTPNNYKNKYDAKNLRSSKGKDFESDDENDENEYTFNRTHTLTREGLVPLSLVNMKKAAIDDRDPYLDNLKRSNDRYDNEYLREKKPSYQPKKDRYHNSDSEPEMTPNSAHKSYQVPRARSNIRDPYKLESLNEPDLSDTKYSSLATNSKRLLPTEPGSKESAYYNKTDQLGRSMKLAPLNLPKSHSDEDIRDKFKKPALINSSRDSTENNNNAFRKNNNNMQVLSYNPYAGRKPNYSQDNSDSENYERKANHSSRDVKKNETSRGFSSRGFCKLINLTT